MHYRGIIAVLALTAATVLAFPLGSSRLATSDAIARSVDDLVKRDPSLDFTAADLRLRALRNWVKFNKSGFRGKAMNETQVSPASPARNITSPLS